MEPKKSSNELGFRRWQQSKRKTSKDMALPITIPISQIPTQVRMTGTSSSIDLPLSSSITSSLFHSRLKTFLFRKSFPPQLSFLPRDAMHPRLAMALCLSVRLSVCLSVCPSQVGVLLKRLNVGSHKQHDTIPQRLQFSGAKDLREIRPGSLPTGAPNAGGVGQNRRLSTNSRLYLENGK